MSLTVKANFFTIGSPTHCQSKKRISRNQSSKTSLWGLQLSGCTSIIPKHSRSLSLDNSSRISQVGMQPASRPCRILCKAIAVLSDILGSATCITCSKWPGMRTKALHLSWQAFNMIMGPPALAATWCRTWNCFGSRNCSNPGNFWMLSMGWFLEWASSWYLWAVSFNDWCEVSSLLPGCGWRGPASCKDNWCNCEPNFGYESISESSGVWSWSICPQMIECPCSSHSTE